ncbi:hypothetical protein GQ457_10G017200 [Hibiscus cannabinus]
MESPQSHQPKKRGRKPKDEKEQQQSAAKMKDGKKSQQQTSVDDKYTRWKSLVLVLYDWLANHNLVWPSLSSGDLSSSKLLTRISNVCTFLNMQTDGTIPNTLVIANCEVVKPRFNEEAQSPFVKKYNTIIHPGEVLIWNVEAQPNSHNVLGATNSRPDLILTGHQDNAEFALAIKLKLIACNEIFFLMRGLMTWKDNLVVLWSIENHIATSYGRSIIKKPGKGNDKADDEPSVGLRGIFCGHEDTVEDVAFCPSSPQEFCSVSDDSCLILWDARVDTNPARYFLTLSFTVDVLKELYFHISAFNSLIVPSFIPAQVFSCKEVSDKFIKF